MRHYRYVDGSKQRIRSNFGEICVSIAGMTVALEKFRQQSTKGSTQMKMLNPATDGLSLSAAPAAHSVEKKPVELAMPPGVASSGAADPAFRYMAATDRRAMKTLFPAAAEVLFEIIGSQA